MSSDPNLTPAPTPTPAPVANESGLSLETEPLVFFHPPGSIQPFPGPFPFDEEPAIWPHVAP